MQGLSIFDSQLYHRDQVGQTAISVDFSNNVSVPMYLCSVEDIGWQEH